MLVAFLSSGMVLLLSFLSKVRLIYDRRALFMLLACYADAELNDVNFDVGFDGRLVWSFNNVNGW